MTGLTSNPTIFDQAIKNSNAYDDAIRENVEGKSEATLKALANHNELGSILALTVVTVRKS